MSPAVTSPFVPSSKNGCEAAPPIAVRSPVTLMPVLASLALKKGGGGRDNRLVRWLKGIYRRSLGWALAAFGILLAAVGAASSFDEVFMNDAVPLAFLGIVLGVAAYMFGAHRVGATAAVFSVAALIFLAGVSQGVLPGVERTDRTLPANEPNAQRPSGVDQRPSDASGN